MDIIKKINDLWQELYPQHSIRFLNEFITELESVKKNIILNGFCQPEPEWYKDAIIYSLYVDLFNTDLPGLELKLDYLKDLGVKCLWLLPILDSPMRDSGFDIRRYNKIRPELLNLPKTSTEKEQQAVFRHFIDEAHKRNIKVIFDIALNHTSNEHEWFIESRKSTDNPYRDYYIWNKDTNKYKDTRLIFKGMCPSNWEKDGDWYFFHRFFEFQPDLNYHNPNVLLAMSRNLLYWLTQGVDGFRADAIPYLWKEDGTDCENLPKTHTIVKFFRAILDFVRPNTLLLAEACQPPEEVVKYFGNGDECHAGYHFPLMPQIFIALALQKAEAVIKTLHHSVTPVIDNFNQWFIFLRLHDELTLEMVNEEDRQLIYNHYCRNPQWDFRVGEGVSARLADLMEYNPQKVGLAYSIKLTLKGTPIVFYGDEFGKTNDEDYYKAMIKKTGKNDTRFFVRGKIDWDKVEKYLSLPDTFSYKVNKIIKHQVQTRSQYKSFGRGTLEWIDLKDKNGNKLSEILSYFRSLENEKILIIQNLSEKNISVQMNNFTLPDKSKDILHQELIIDFKNNSLELKPYGYCWILY